MDSISYNIMFAYTSDRTESTKFQQNQKAWHSIKDNEYKSNFYPVTVVRSFPYYAIVSDGRNEYKVSDDSLFPRSQRQRNVNEAELCEYLQTKKREKGKSKGSRFVKIENEVMIDTLPHVQVGRDEELNNFYFEHVQSLIVCEQNKEKNILAYSNSKHGYVIQLLQMIQESSLLWNYKGKINGVMSILQSLLKGVHLQISLGFNNVKGNVKMGKIQELHIRPFIIGLHEVPESIVKMMDNDKCKSMYRSPLNNKNRKESVSQLNALSTALLNINFSPSQVHSIFGFISALANIRAMRVEKFTIQNNEYYRISNDNNNMIQNLGHILKVSPQQLRNRIVYGQNAGKEYCRDGSQLMRRLKALQIIVYEMFISELCHKVNAKLKNNVKEQDMKWLSLTSINIHNDGICKGQINSRISDMIGHNIVQITRSDKLGYEQQGLEEIQYGRMLDVKKQQIEGDNEIHNQHIFNEEYLQYRAYEQLKGYDIVIQMCFKLMSTFSKHNSLRSPIPHRPYSYVISNDVVFLSHKPNPYQMIFSKHYQHNHESMLSTLAQYIKIQQIHNQQKKYNIGLQLFGHRYKYSSQFKRELNKYKKQKKMTNKYRQEQVNSQTVGKLWDYFTRQEQQWIDIIKDQNSHHNTQYTISISANSFMKLQTQYKQLPILLKRIMNQYRAYRQHKMTIGIVHRLSRESKFNKLMQKMIKHKKKSTFKDIRRYVGTVQIYFLIKQKVITKYNDEFTKIRHFAVLKTIQKTYYHNLLKKYLIGFEDIANDAYVKKVLSRYIIVNDNIIKRNKKQKLEMGWYELRQRAYKVNIKSPQFILNPQQQMMQPQKAKNSSKVDNREESNSKKSQCKYKYLQPQENLKELAFEELTALQDNPVFSLQKWETGSFIKSEREQELITILFTKYETLSLKNSSPINLVKAQKELKIDDYVSEQMTENRFLYYCNTHIDKIGDQKFEDILKFQRKQLYRPLIKEYPIKEYPNLYKQSFNCMMKMGGTKGTSKSFHQLLNILQNIVQETYKKEEKTVEDIFGDEPMMIPDYKSYHNIVKDEIFLHFIKQMMQNISESGQKELYKGLSIFSRYYYPSPEFIYSFLEYMTIYNKNVKSKYVEQTLQNTMRFVQAMQGNKGHSVRVFKEEKKKSEVENAGNLYYRTTRITQKQTKGLLQIRLRLLNNQQFHFPVRNEILKTIKKYVLIDLGFANKEKYFGLYLLKKNNIFQPISDQYKAIDYLCSPDAQYPLYLKIKHYFPFKVKELNASRLVYLNMIWDQRFIPWTPQNYEYVAAQAMAYDQFEQLRISNYLIFTNQTKSKKPNINPIQEKYKMLKSTDLSKKVCEFEYLKYMKQMGFLLIKMHLSLDENISIGVKPFEMIIFNGTKRLCSIEMKRVKNVYMIVDVVVLQLMFRNKNGKNQLRQHTVKKMMNPKQLFTDILHHLENKNE